MIKVLVIDDSLFMRTLVSDMLNSNPEIKVIGTAKNGKEAMNKILKLKPDCVTLDLAMPDWDGLTTLEQIMVQYPTPVVILSAHSKEDADITIKCLEAGAVSFVLKPSGEISLDIEKVRLRLIEEVQAASRVDVQKLEVRKRARRITHDGRRTTDDGRRVVIIGASTGGPQALEKILSSLPINFPFPIIIVQHMPTKFFTDSFAKHLGSICDLDVRVAEDSELLRSGRVYLVPAGYQLILKASSVVRIPSSERNTEHEIRNTEQSIRNTDVMICLNKARTGLLSPSIDITMESAVKVYDGNTLGIILSGIGRDGCAGMKAIKTSGGKTIAQDETSLIFGMPKEVIHAGYADKVLPAEKIAEAMMEYAS